MIDNDEDPYTTSKSTSRILMKHSTHILRQAWEDAIQDTKKAIAIDATAGRGSDTLSLSQMLGRKGTVHSIDIQSMAICETRKRHEELVDENKSELMTYVNSHANLQQVTGLMDGEVSLVTYNLGWCPMREADKYIVTQSESTIESLNSAKRIVCKGGGLISVMCYVGHSQGHSEHDSVVRWCSALDKKVWNVIHVNYPNRKQSPHLLLCKRIPTSKMNT